MGLCGWPLEAVEFFGGQQAGNRDDRLGPWFTLLVRPDQHIAWPAREPAWNDFEVVTGGRFHSWRHCHSGSAIRWGQQWTPACGGDEGRN